MEKQQITITVPRVNWHTAWRFAQKWLLPNPGTLVLMIVLLLTVPTLAGPFQNLNTASISTIPYQGRLADASGNPITSKQNMEFRLYNTPTGGTPLWEEFWTGGNSVDVSDGLFSVMLGSINTNLASVVQGNNNLYLGITVGTDSEMEPRVQLGSVPFSIWSLSVADGSVTTAKIADGAVTRDKIATDLQLPLIQSGAVMGHAGLPDWTLASGTGSRSYTIHVTFPQSFVSAPAVVVSTFKFDFSATVNQRLDVYAQNITPTGFDLVLHTWADTVVYQAGATWIAYAGQ